MPKRVYWKLYIQQAIELSKQVDSPMGGQIALLESAHTHPVETYVTSLKTMARQSDKTWLKDYININPTLEVHSMYQTHGVPEWARMNFTRLRLGSHRLRIETGRWSRIARELRFCVCGPVVQSEEHILLHCPRTAHLRLNFNPATSCDNIAELFNTTKEFKYLALFCHAAQAVFENWLEILFFTIKAIFFD
jgi:hypothetical protein